MVTTLGDTLLFLRSLLRDPSRIGAVAPSGRSLANLITADLTAFDKPIIELGPGTGAFTQVLIERGVPEHRLVLVEADPAFAQTLTVRFPRARVLAMDATRLLDLGELFDEPVGAVVSGLPLVSTPLEKVGLILQGAFRHLRPGGAMYQFTYFPRCPVPWRLMHEMDLEAVRIGCALANVPPAFVYRLRRISSETSGLPRR